MLRKLGKLGGLLIPVVFLLTRLCSQRSSCYAHFQVGRADHLNHSATDKVSQSRPLGITRSRQLPPSPQSLNLTDASPTDETSTLPPLVVRRVGNTSIRYVIRDREIKPYVPPVLAYQMEPSPSLKYCLSYCNIKFLSHGGEVSRTDEKNARLNEYPHVAALGYGTGEEMEWSSNCSGSLISRNFVLTAAHCVDSKKPTKVRIGEPNYELEKPQILPVSSITIHPAYKSSTPIQNDIALVKLATPVRFTSYMRPACLHKTQGSTSRVDSPFISTRKYGIAGVETTLDYWTAQTTRWISRGNAPNDTEHLNIVDINSCGSPSIKETCTGISDKGKGPCGGDIGSAVHAENSLFDGNRQCPVVVVGITSAGTHCSETGTECDATDLLCNQTDYPSVYTRIYSHVPWIESVVWPGESKPDNPMRRHLQEETEKNTKQSGSLAEQSANQKPEVNSTSKQSSNGMELEKSHGQTTNQKQEANSTSKQSSNGMELKESHGQTTNQTGGIHNQLDDAVLHESVTTAGNTTASTTTAKLSPPVIIQSNTSSLTFIMRDRELDPSIPPAADYVKDSVSLRYCLSYCNIKFIKYGGEMSTVLETENAWVNEYPHVVSLGFENGTLQGKSNVTWNTCAGSLISRNFVLTAAHCMFSDRGKPTQVRVGEYEPQFFSILDIFIHPEYSNVSQYNDIALVKLVGHVTFTKYMRPACLHTGHASIEDTDRPWKPIATSWRPAGANFASDILQKVKMEMIDGSTCNKLLGSNENIPSGVSEKTQLCAEVLNEDKDAFLGGVSLEGSPLQVNNTMYHWLRECPMSVVGITSNGAQGATEKSPHIYARVQHFVPWIESIVWSGET